MHTEQVKNAIINGKSFFDQPVKNKFNTYYHTYYYSIQKILTAQGDDYTTGWLLDYNYFKDYYKMITIDISKQQVLDAVPKAKQQINFTGNLKRDGNENTTRNVTRCKNRNDLLQLDFTFKILTFSEACI